MAKPSWRAVNFRPEEKCGIEGYAYDIINDHDQVISCWKAGSREIVEQTGRTNAERMNKNAIKEARQNSKQRINTMRSCNYSQ